MRLRPLLLFLAFVLFRPWLVGQYSIGVQGGPLFFQGAWEAKQALTNTHGWTAGIQIVEGRRGQQGFKIGLDIGQRAYTIRANSDDSGVREEFSSVSTMLWMSFEMRWSLSRRHRIYFDLGPVIGVELHEERQGVRFYEGYDVFGTAWETDRIVISETESGFAIRDGHWRFGFSAEWPVAGRWLVTSGAHLCPGVGSWALNHGYATWDADLRAGVLFRLHGKKQT
ncbi:MAG: hypothetical protein IPP83_18630 [Flavobacteriales bacterium]|nr:hypothetical protein [Flavobacteriales bacterium]